MKICGIVVQNITKGLLPCILNNYCEFEIPLQYLKIPYLHLIRSGRIDDIINNNSSTLKFYR